MVRTLLFVFFLSFLNINPASASLQGLIAEASTDLLYDEEDLTQQIKAKTDEIEDIKNLKLGKITTILSIALITILTLLTLALYKNNKLRARANKLLKQKNAELIAEKERAENASAVKAQFLSTITHELRTPLYAVTGLTHLLLEENPTENQKEHLNSLRFSGEYLLSLINNILDLNKLEANKVEVEITSFNLKKRISDVLIALNKAAEDRGNKLNLNFDSKIPKRVKGDPLKISQILINLIGNAIKFTKNGQINIHVLKVKDVDGNKMVLYFEVEDNGVGISEKKKYDIFENFNQESLEVNRKYGGTGLGLSIVKNLLSLLDSEIKLNSTVGKGSKFFFELEFGLYQESEITKKEKALSTINFKEMEGRRVLIVEDNKINQLITRKILEKNKIICEVADNGEIAVEKAKKFSYDLILMDIHMPGISGVEATNQIRKFDMRTPVIALTAVTLADHMDEFYANGITDVIPKPYKTEEFFLKLQKVFRGEYEVKI
ncbi:response regulator [Aquimarina agarivorans]|uniref:response regulator n=1 Tax=Aquimarina agarivorans TaxID=980584 RepID=UPI000248E60C|nr:response regulator [Aquimarina agarivorans]